MFSSQYGEGGGYMGSPSTGSLARKSETAHSLRPLTILQLHAASQMHPDADWTLDDREIGQVTVVAHIISVQSQATNNQYVLNDGTGHIEARRWVDSSVEEDSDKRGIVEGAYVRVLGTIKVFGSRRYINVTHVRPIQSPMEVYFHLLEVMTVTLYWEGGLPPRPGQNPQDVMLRGGQPSTSAYSVSSRQTTDTGQFSHLPPLQRNIINFMQSQTSDDTGIHVSAIARAIGGDAVAISDALDKLMDDGLVFSTIDESHFQLAT